MARSLREKDINWNFWCLTLQMALHTDLKKLYKGMKKNIKINKTNQIVMIIKNLECKACSIF